MTGRGKRGRGRGGKARSNNGNLVIRKPRSSAPSEASSRASTPQSTPGKSRVSTRLKGKAKSSPAPAPQPRSGINFAQLADPYYPTDESEAESDSSSDSDLEDDLDDDFKGESEDEAYEDDEQKPGYVRRWPSPEIPIIEEDEVALLELPTTSTDLVIPVKNVMQCMSIYEVLRRFSKLLRLSPFLFEDFCAALVTEEQSAMLTEIHCQMIRAILREEDSNNTIFCPPDLKDSVNVSLFFLDAMTFTECIRAYLDGDKSKEFRAGLPPLEKSTYCETQIEERLQILQTLTDIYLSSNAVREELLKEGNIQYDDHCRNCHRLGDLLCCETCSAVYHLTCVEPPLEEIPEDDWQCNICEAHKVKGVTDCVSDMERSGQLIRQEPLGYDRHHRKYYFVCRRIVVEGESESWYYSTEMAYKELMRRMSDSKYERILLLALEELQEEIVKQMKITEELTNESRGTRKSVLSQEIAQREKAEQERLEKEAAGEDKDEGDAENMDDDGEKTEDQKDEAMEDDTESNSGRMVTRSKTGSLIPSVVNGDDDDGVMTTRGKAKMTAAQQLMNPHSQYYRLGQECSFKDYVNQYTSNQLALNKHQHNEDRDRRRYLSHKFSLTPASEFRWSGNVFGARTLVMAALRMGLTSLEAGLPAPFLHTNWPLHRANWLKAVNMCQTPRDFAFALAMLESCIKPVLFNNVWHDALGHLRLHRVTALEREETKKKEKIEQRLASKKDDNEEVDRSTWAKYTLGLKHQVWKQKGEEYRIVHGDGWLWQRATRVIRSVPASTVGLRPVAKRLQAWKAARRAQLNDGETKEEPKEEPMDTDEKPEEKSDEKLEENASEDAVKSEENHVDQVKSDEVKMEVDEKDKEDSKKDVKDVKDTLGKVTIKVEFGSTEEDALATNIEGVLDVSDALLKHTHYPKVPKPPSKLDSLLERRIRQHAYEMRQKSIIEQVLMKFKIQENARKALKESKEKTKQQEKKDATAAADDLEIEAPAAMAKKQKKQEEEESRRRVKKCSCYSAVCVLASSPDGDPHAVNDICYSFSCQKKAAEDRAKGDETKTDMNELSDDSDTEESNTDSKDKKEVNEGGDGNKSTAPAESGEKRMLTKDEFDKEKQRKLGELRASLLPDLIAPVHQLCNKMIMSVPLLSLQYLMAGGKLQITPSVIPDLQAKYYMIGRSEYRIQLARFARGTRAMPKNRSVIKKGTLPAVHKFLAPSGRRSIMVLDKYIQRIVSRRAGKTEVPGFHYTCKMNNVHWPYVCPRPHFSTAWRYRLQSSTGAGTCSLALVALQLRILWAAIRWDDMQVKAPQGGTNTVTTETDITTTELLKKRDVGPHQLRSEYLVRRIVVPLGIQDTPKEKYTPQRSGLRKRKQADPPKQKEPSLQETWVPQEQLELWEIKQFGEKIEKMRSLVAEKTSKEAILKSTQLADKANAEVKAKMEEELKSQRINMQQKRLELAGKGTVSDSNRLATATPTVSTPTNVVKIATTSSGGVLNKLIQPKTLFTTTKDGRQIRVGMPAGVGAQGNRFVVRPRTIVTTTTSSTVTGPRPIAPSPAAAKPTVQLATAGQTPRAVAPAPSPGGSNVQNLRIIQLPNGQLQVQGLMPGQRLVRMADGKLQLITSTPAPTVTTTQSSEQSPAQQGPPTLQPQTTTSTAPIPTAASEATPDPPQPSPPQAPLPLQPKLEPKLEPKPIAPAPAPAPTIQVQQATPTAAVAATSVPTPRPTAIIASSAGPQQILLQSPPKMITSTIQGNPAPMTLLQTASGGQVAVVGSTAGGQVLLQQAPQQAQPLLISSSQLPPGSQPILVKTQTGQQVLIRPSPAVPTTSQQAITVKSPSQPLAPRTTTTTTAAPTVINTESLQATAATGTAGLPKNVVQQVVRQAMLQNQDPEIQAKLEAMQKHMDKPPPPKPLIIKPLTAQTNNNKTVQAAQNLTPEEKDEQQRLSVAGQVLKGIVEKLERREKAEHRQIRKRKAEETADEKQRRAANSKLSSALLRHKDLLKKEMLKKRAVMEKVYSTQIQVDIASQLSQHHKVPPPPPSSASLVSSSKKASAAAAALSSLPPMPPSSAMLRQKQLQQIGNPPPSSAAVTTASEQPPPAKKRRNSNQKSNTTATSAGAAAAAAKMGGDKLYCVCKTPYDDTKFYIGCDLCSNWFHGDCVGIDENSAQKMDSFICEECKAARDNSSEELYCLCRTPYDESQFYIGCDTCQDWFHGACVGVTQAVADKMDTYVCPNCQKQGANTDHTLSDVLIEAGHWGFLAELLASLKGHKMAWPFLKPVNPGKVPNYYRIVKDPMDLSKVERRLDARQYLTMGEYIKDITKIFDNCRYYNTTDSAFYQCAEVLETHFIQKLKALKEQVL